MRGLYAIVDVEACAERDPALVAAAILRGGCAILQLRAKSLDDRDFVELAQKVAALCAAREIPFVVNDRADIAALAHAGLHVGQDDLPLEAARRVLGDAASIGVSTHSLAQALEAERRGASLIGFGPVFPTTSKARPDPVVGLAQLREVCASVQIPVVAIGGVTLARAAEIRDAGAQLGACIAALCRAVSPELAARELHLALGGSA